MGVDEVEGGGVGVDSHVGMARMGGGAGMGVADEEGSGGAATSKGQGRGTDGVVAQQPG